MKRIEKIRHLFIDVSPIERLLEFSTPYYPVVSGVLDIVYEKNQDDSLTFNITTSFL